jgi:hypothetical protein
LAPVKIWTRPSFIGVPRVMFTVSKPREPRAFKTAQSPPYNRNAATTAPRIMRWSFAMEITRARPAYAAIVMDSRALA